MKREYEKLDVRHASQNNVLSHESANFVGFVQIQERRWFASAAGNRKRLLILFDLSQVSFNLATLNQKLDKRTVFFRVEA